jgi:hydroxypyruvate isomerase
VTVSELRLIRLAPHLGLTSPHDGLFIHHAGLDPIDQISFIADNGFDGVEDNFLQMRSCASQTRIGSALVKHRLTMGCFVGTMTFDRPTFVDDAPESRASILNEMMQLVESADRVGGRNVTMLLGRTRPDVPRDWQFEIAADHLRRCSDIVERAGLNLLIEPISRKRWPDVVVSSVQDACDLCRKVGRSAVGVLFDAYQCHREGDDLLSSLDLAWDHLGAVQIADDPGRCEPGTGQIDFPAFLSKLRDKGWTGLVELEHAAATPSLDGERRVLDVYRDLQSSL